MSNVVDRVFAEVCLDERVSDGIFQMENEEHMNALRDYFVKKGIPQEAAIQVTNRMVEGKYPERQAYRTEDGILVTWPSPQHKKRAMAEHPGKYVEENPFPKRPSEKEPEKREPIRREPPPKEEPKDKDKDEDDKSLPRSGGSVFGGEKITQGDKKLEIEPPRGEEKPEPPASAPPVPTIAPRTPERIAAEKEVVKQILGTDNNALANITGPLKEENKELLRYQLNELYKKADALGFKEAVTFLTPYVKP